MVSPPIRRDQLANGLTVLRLPRAGWPVMTADVWVATGSANESPDQAGISHFLEHMMFKGTERRGPGELDRLVEGVGGYWNAGTSKDFTHCYLTVPAPHRALAIDALADAVLRSVIAPEEVDRERQVILEEWRRSEDNPSHVLHMRLHETAHATGSYRWPVIGTRETIRAITREQIAAYHRARCRPATMTLVLAGDVAGDAVLDEIAAHFTWPDAAAAPASALPEPRWNAGGTRTIPRDVNEVYLAVAWPGPSAREFEPMVAMDVVQTVLGDGRASRLYQRLHEEERVVTTVGVSYPAHRVGGLFGVFATCEPAKADAARAAIEREVTALGDQPPDAAEIARAKRLLTNHHLFSRETTAGHTASVGYHHTLTESPAFDDEYPARVEAVTAEAMMAAARQHLTPGTAATVAVHPVGHPLAWEAPA